MYAKLKDGILYYAPNTIHLDSMTIVNPNEKQLETLGYLPVVKSEAPQATDDMHYVKCTWEQTKTEIRQVWTIVELPPMELTQEEKMQMQIDDLTLAMADILGGNVK